MVARVAAYGAPFNPTLQRTERSRGSHSAAERERYPYKGRRGMR